ncbi:hypothetical protein cyc_03494 [Cyclospora cayetanensis]|uniref:Uncharacterized protein n=1 Tax=Cyclospora cayetanensis TaxID=88456 RepID=A0A1D3CXP4_9EIME|nr:hypothetical protein cyc_03494 [Cyclospora cayetanensis]
MTSADGVAQSSSCCPCQWLLLLFLCIGALHTIYAAKALRWVKKAAAGWETLTEEERLRYGPFERLDWNSLSTSKILLGAFFLVRFEYHKGAT